MWNDLEKHSHKFGDLLKFGPGDVPVGEELRTSGPHREVHVKFALALLQRELATAQERHQSFLI